MSFTEAMRWVANALDGFGVLIIVIGAITSTALFLLKSVKCDWLECYKSYRHSLGRAILLGLEFLVAGDIIRTVAVEPTLSNVGVLGIIVLIRTFLSMAMEYEVEGKLPWRKEEPQQ